MTWTVHSYNSVASTMDVARDHLQAGDALPFAVRADQQTKGRGRYGRVWQSPVGNLMTTLVIPLPNPEQASLYSYAAVLAIRDALALYLAERAHALTLKWPNDLLLDGKKVGGALLEVDQTRAGGTVLLIGIGVNLVTHPEDTPYSATSLQAYLSKEVRVLDVLQQILKDLDHWRGTLEKEGFEPLRQAWLAARDPRHECLSLRQGGGRAFGNVDGTFDDLDASGALVLKVITAQGVETVQKFNVGDVFFPPKKS